MRYLMKYLQQVGLVSTLLTGGVLGGLLAPLPSEALPLSASPTVTLQMDANPPTTTPPTLPGTKITLNTQLSTCLATDISPGGYNYCYAVTTGGIVTGTSGRQYRVDPNGTPRVRIADKNGQDKMSLTGVQFVPVGSWPDNESHTLTLTLSAKLDATTDGAGGAAINATNAGIYKWAVRSSGEFLGSPNSDPVGNTLVLSGVGTFSPTNKSKPILSTENPKTPTDRRGTKNLTTLSFNILGPADTADLNWGGTSNTDMGQVDPYYPEFDCRGGTADTYPENTVALACRPTITQTLTATIKGGDTLKVLAGPLDVLGVKCTETISPQQTKQIAFLKVVVKVLTVLVPKIHDEERHAKAQNFLIQLNTLLASLNAPPDLECPGARVLAFNIAVEAAPDVLFIATASSKPGITAPLHHYAVVNSPGLTWEAARSAAQALSTGGNVCDLATITSATEQVIINGILPNPSEFAGTTQDYWVGGIQDNCEGGEVGGPGCHWRWINNEGEFWNDGPVVGMYANWGSTSTGPANEPNNAGGNENNLTVDNRYGWGWNDLNTNGPLGKTEGYITEGTAGPCEPPPVIIN